jgi:hypothetical protein
MVPAGWMYQMKNLLLVGILFVLWFASMMFYLPLAVTVVLFAALVSTTSIVSWLALMKRRGAGQRPSIKPDAKAGI